MADFHDSVANFVKAMAYIARIRPDLEMLSLEQQGSYHSILGDLLSNMGQNDKALQHYLLAIESFQQDGDSYFLAYSYYAAGLMNRDMANYEQALAYLKEHQKLVYKNKITHEYFYNEYGLASVLQEAGYCDKALVHADNALTLGSVRKDFYAQLYKIQTRCFLQMNDIKQAKTAYQKAAPYYEALPTFKDSKWGLEYIELEAQMLSATEFYQEAFKKQVEYTKARIKQIKNDYSEQFLRSQLIQEQAEQRATMTKLENDNRLKVLELSQARQRLQLQVGLIIAVLLAIIAIAYVLYLSWRSAKIHEELSILDPLTDIYNRRYTYAELDKWIKETDRTFSLVLFDIDYFKKVNDQYGHVNGDHVLKHVANLAKKNLRPGDFVARLGGEEFLIVLPRINADKAREIAERTRKTIAETPINLAGLSLQTTASFGVCESEVSIDEVDTLLERADQALYKAKASGRNCVINWTPKIGDMTLH